jgi:hypothetical protein
MRNQSMGSNLASHIQADQEVDPMRVSYNVVKNMQMLNKNDSKQQQATRTASKSPNSKGGNQGMMPNTPLMNKPVAVLPGDTQNDYESYNINVKNRNSKLNKGKAFEKDIDDEPAKL